MELCVCVSVSASVRTIWSCAKRKTHPRTLTLTLTEGMEPLDTYNIHNQDKKTALDLIRHGVVCGVV